ncbi:hypothetical protein SAMN04488134_11344 [Amphibacillus marinus]|uniref:Uncharacterized protein n=1 Tax=Amphibacillus marinus TaxID=872970 RepID=A0A1H8SN44_9BACI|nr:hypothetical protein [Amphibacillus marinus]SEO79977.1 hypothetical protein SAMN04488134_11344 [Amphibacillus marinus]
MDLIIKQSHAAVLLLSMSMSRRNVKRTFKKAGNKHLLEQYDGIKSHLEQNINGLSDGQGDKHCRLLLSVVELEMIDAFTDWYVPKVRKVLKQATNNKVSQIDQEQLQALVDIKAEIEVLAYA